MKHPLQQLVPTVIAWSNKKGRVKRLWFYGSRWKKTNTAQSDLDICVEIDPVMDEEERVCWFQSTKAEWQAELTSLCGLHVHLEPYATDQQKAFIADESWLVYQREI